MIETMTVTMIVPVDRRRCKVFLDEGFAFVLYRGELEQYGICEGFEISQKLYQRIEEEILEPRARDLCLRLLGDSDRSERQLRERLARAGFPQRVVGRVMDYLREYRYTDDRRMAAYYVESRGRVKSKRQLAWELREKGIDPETAREALEKAPPEGEAIRRLIERRTGGRTPGSRKEWQKLYGYLGRKGFSFEEIRRVLGDVPERDESELPDRENP